MNSRTQTSRTTVARAKDRGRYDRDTINAIVDEALICHVGFSVDGQTYVLPTAHARIGDRLYIHGSVGSRMLKNMRVGVPVCVTITLLDGLVLARSAFNHSMNYRSAVVRAANAKELKATSVLCLLIEEASAKIRRGPPLDAEEDYALECWAGVLPMQMVSGHPVDDPRLEFGTPVPSAIAAYMRQRPPSDID